MMGKCLTFQVEIIAIDHEAKWVSLQWLVSERMGEEKGEGGVDEL